MRHLIALFLLSACAGEPRAPQRILLERHPCLGTCPSYRLAITTDGRVEYEGVGYFVGYLDPMRPARERALFRRDSTHVSPNEVVMLTTAFDRAWSRWWPNRYRPGRFVCPGAGTDAGGLTIVRERGPASDTLDVYHGCPFTPPRIRRLGAYIDSVVGVGRWLGPNRLPAMHRWR